MNSDKQYTVHHISMENAKLVTESVKNGWLIFI